MKYRRGVLLCLILIIVIAVIALDAKAKTVKIVNSTHAWICEQFRKPLSSLTPTPTQAARSTPTPYPTPVFKPASYLPVVPKGPVAHVSGPDLARKVQAAQDDPKIVSVFIEGGGSFDKQVTLKKHTKFDSATYSCDWQDGTDYGAFLIADNVLVEGTWRMPQVVIDYFRFGNGHNANDPYLLKVQALTSEQLAGKGTTILEPTYIDPGSKFPAVEVFEALGDACCSHTGKAKNIAVVGFHIKGRQTAYDGGVRSTILFGNCERCTAQNNYLDTTASIGIQFGGSALEKNNYAKDVLAWRNITRSVPAANIAAVNAEQALIIENYALKLGREAPFGGGVCGFDLETNSPADHSKEIHVYNNLYDFEGGRNSAGSAICVQDPYRSANHGLVVVANNVAIGGRMDNLYRFMSNGLFLNGLKGCQVVNNYVFRTGQNALQAYNIEGCLIQDNDFESTGGGGNPTVWTQGAKSNTFKRNNYRDRPNIGVSTQAGFTEVCGANNVYEGNLIHGAVTGANRTCSEPGQRPQPPRL